jgi:hypothetical protein
LTSSNPPKQNITFSDADQNRCVMVDQWRHVRAAESWCRIKRHKSMDLPCWQIFSRRKHPPIRPIAIEVDTASIFEIARITPDKYI